MRATIALLLLASLFGLIAMPEQAPGDDKKETKPLKVTVKSWDAMGKKFLNPCDVDARKVELNGAVAFFIPLKQAIGTGEPRKGSEITEADGTVYVVKSGNRGGSEFQAAVEKKP